jgi:hypothetical protein
MCGWMCGCVGGCVDVWVDVVYHPPSIITLTHSLRSFVASPVQSYGVNAGVVFCRGVCAPYWFIERSSAVGGRYPLKSYGGRRPGVFYGGFTPPTGLSNEVPAVGGRYPRGTPAVPPQTIPRDHNTV